VSTAERAFWTTPRVSRHEAEERTVAWIRSRDWKAPPPPATSPTPTPGHALGRLHQIHLLYGLLFLALGSSAFFHPQRLAAAMGVPVAPLPSPDAMIAQTVGLIVFVLGSYRYKNQPSPAWDGSCSRSPALLMDWLVSAA
jgi:hypothetical protein